MSDATPATMLPDRTVIRVSGDDPRGFLQGLVTNDLALLSPAQPLWAGLLSAQGKALFDFILWAGEDGAVLIDAESERAEALVRRLALYRLRRAIAIEPAGLRVHWAPDGTRGMADPRLPALGRRWLAAPGAAAHGWLAHRLSFGVTEGVTELGDGDTLWLECNARELGGVSFAKGCYVGQENTARMHHRATVNRRLVVTPLGQESGRARASYPDLDLAVERRRIDALGDARMPDWLAAALSASQRPTAT